MILEEERDILSLSSLLETIDIFDIDEYYYSFGNYLYENLELEIQVNVNLDIFKYILGKYYSEALYSQN